MNSTITLQAILLRFYSAVTTAGQDNNVHQLLALSESLDLLFDVLATFQFTSLAALIQDLFDTVQDTLSQVQWKSTLPTYDEMQTIINAYDSVGSPNYPAIVNAFVFQAIVRRTQATRGQAVTTVVLHPNMVGTYGDETFFWTATVTIEGSNNDISVQVALDKEGYLSVNHVTT